MSKTLKKTDSYLSDVKEYIIENEERCKNLSECMELLGWKWFDSNFTTPTSTEIRLCLLELFERTEEKILRFDYDALKESGCYSVCCRGFVINFLYSVKSMELYGLRVYFDIYGYKKREEQ